jgi:hypothetical protein
MFNGSLYSLIENNSKFMEKEFLADYLDVLQVLI